MNPGKSITSPLVFLTSTDTRCSFDRSIRYVTLPEINFAARSDVRRLVEIKFPGWFVTDTSTTSKLVPLFNEMRL